MRTKFFKVAVSLLTETFPGSRRWRGLPVLVVISPEDCRGVPLTPAVDLGPALLLVTNTDTALTTRVGWTASDTLVLSGPPGEKQDISILTMSQQCQTSHHPFKLIVVNGPELYT